MGIFRGRGPSRGTGTPLVAASSAPQCEGWLCPVCGTQQGSGGLGQPRGAGAGPSPFPAGAEGLMRAGTPGRKGILHHQGQALPSPSPQGSPSGPLSQRHPQAPFTVLGVGWKRSLLSPPAPLPSVA